MAPRRSVQNARTERWTRLQRASPTQRVTFRVTLAAARSDAELEARVHAIADVASPTYGQYTRASTELAELWAPHAEATQALNALVMSIGGLDAVVNDARDVWMLRMAAATAESLFATELYTFAHTHVAGLTVVRPRDSYSLPGALERHVVYIDGLESFPTEVQAQYMAQNGDPFAVKHYTLDAAKRNVVTPAMIRTQYDIPDDLTLNGSHAHNTLVIGSFLHEFYSEPDLTAFLTTYDPAFARTHPRMPATRGDCVAGRPGSAATRATGEASLDIQVAAAIARSESVEMVCYTNLRDDSRPQAADNQEPFLAFLQEVNARNPPPAVVSISYTDDECSVPRAYALAVNRELMKAAMRGVTVVISAGDAGAQGSHLAGFCGVPSCTRFLANFPASSPYVTAVGATSFDTGRNSSVAPGKFREVVTSTEDGALITSGGGFSELFSRPTYQDRAVKPYLASAQAAGIASLFNVDGRAYPDIAALGHAFPVIENGKMFPTDGTSVSAPLVAAMVALLNRQRLMVGKPALGFLNPLLYQLYDVCPDVFADVTEGDIACGSRDMACCSRSHAATVGWDAASGVGTLRFQQFASRLDGCIELIQSQQHERISLLADSRSLASSGQFHELVLTVALFAGVVLASALVALRVRRKTREPTREHLLARDPSRV